MTFREKQLELLADLLEEKEQYPQFQGMYDRKIAALKVAMGEVNANS